MISLSTTVVLFFVAVLTSIISAVTSMAGGTILLSLMSLFLPFQLLVPLHGVIQLVSNSSRTVTLFRQISWRLILPYAAGLPFGVWVAINLIRQVENKEVFHLFIAGLIFYTLFKPKSWQKIVLPVPLFFFVGLCAGFLSPLVGATGPFLSPFFLRDELDKKSLVASVSMAQTLTHLLKIPAFLSLGFNYIPHLGFIAALSVAAFVGTYLGVRLLDKVNEKLFLKIFKVVLFVIACRLVVVSLMGMSGGWG